jgi:hypothetical protein
VDGYRLLDYQVFVLRFWREPSSGTWRGQVVHLPDQQMVSFAHWEQAQAYIQGYLPTPGSLTANLPEQ